MNCQPLVPGRWFEACARDSNLDTTQYINAIILAGIASNAKLGYAFIPVPSEMRELLPPHVFDRLTM